MDSKEEISYNDYSMKEIAKGITVDPKFHFGKPVIAGTRIPVNLIVKEIAGGMTPAEIMKEYDVTEEQVRNALDYAALRVEEELTIV